MAEPAERITADLIEQTPIEKCSLNPRRGRNSRRLLTGFIIYASEVRKEVVEKYPDQNFGFISKLVGDKWRALDTDARFKYHQRALIHNKRIKELAAREGVSLGDIDLANGSVITTPKPIKNKTKKLKEGKRRINDSRSQTPNFDSSSSSMPETPNGKKANGIGNISYSNDMSATPGGAVTPAASKTFITRHPEDHQYLQNTHTKSKKVNTVDSATQTPQIKFIEPPPKKTLRFSDAFLKNLPELIRNVQTARAQVQ